MARRKRRTFTAKFKADAVRLVTTGGKTIGEVRGSPSSKRRAMSADNKSTNPITSAQSPDVDLVRQFLSDMLARGAVRARAFTTVPSEPCRMRHYVP